MKNVKLNYLIVGSFTLLVIAGLIVAVALLSGRTGATDEYHALYDNVTGVQFGTRVLYEGFPIGQVEEIVPIQIDGKTRFRVEMSVISGWKIPQDTVAEIAASGLLAAVTITMREGKSPDTLKPGAQIASREASNVMSAVGDLARDIRELTESDIKPMLARIHIVVQSFSDMLGGEQGTQMGGDVRKMMQTVTQAAPEIVRHIDIFSKRLEALMSEQNLKAMDSIIANMNTSAINMADVTKQLGATRTSIDGLLGEIRAIVVDNKDGINQSVGDLRHTTETIARYIDSINQNLDITARNMSEFSRAIRQNPGLLLGGGAPATDSTTGKR